MITDNDIKLEINHFPDGTLLLKPEFYNAKTHDITWYYEGDAELMALIALARYLRDHGAQQVRLYLPYVPNARQDRTKKINDVFTLKYFAEVINSLNFDLVEVFDPHSNVAVALLDRVEVINPTIQVETAVHKINDDKLVFFYPDEGAMKRYSEMLDYPYVFGVNNRDLVTNQIRECGIFGRTELIAGRNILIVDDICSLGEKFCDAARKLKDLGAQDIYLYISHCEHTIFQGGVLTSGLIKKVFTTNSIYHTQHDMIEVIDLL